MTGTIEPFDPAARSNFAHDKPLVVQAWDVSLGKWLDTIHGNVNLPACEQYTLPVVLEPERWIGGHVGRVRIVHRLRRRK